MLLYFILGILFIEIAVPIIEALVALILSLIEVGKGKCTLKISKMNMELRKLEEDEEPEIAERLIGFTAPSEDYDMEEEDDE